MINKKKKIVFLFGIFFVIFSLLYISAFENNWINGFNPITGEVREGGNVLLKYYGEVRCESYPCSFIFGGVSIGFADKTSGGAGNNIPAVLSSNLSCSGDYIPKKTVSVPCSDCPLFQGGSSGNGVTDFVGFGDSAGLIENGGETIPVINCIDSDSGSDIFNKGTVKFVDEFGQSYEKEDYCKEDFFTSQIIEYSCEGNTLLKKKSYSCLGSECIDGACKKSITCIDSDSGKDYFSKGTATVEYSDGSITENTDLCVWGVLQEFYCENGSVNLASYTCSNSICSDGACGCGA